MALRNTDIGRLILDNIFNEKTASSKKDVDVVAAKDISSGLSKLASFPYNETVYESVKEIMKIASSTISDLINSFESVKNRTSELEKAAEVRSLIDEMVSHGYINEFNVHEKVSEFMSKSASQIAVTKEAMKLMKGGKQGNIFDETEKNARDMSQGKKGMFDDIID